MLRVLLLTALICVYCGTLPSVFAKTHFLNSPAATVISNSDTTSTANTNVTPSITAAEGIDSNEDEERHYYYHPYENKKPYVIEEFNRHYLDGSYEYKYVLSNGVTRYEKAFWKLSLKGKKLLARKGFYSHPLPNQYYLTVFYTADEYGYQQDTTKYTNVVPTLPKYLDVPQLGFPHETSRSISTTPTTPITMTTTTRKPTTTRKITTLKPRPITTTTTTQRPVVKPSNFNWIY